MPFDSGPAGRSRHPAVAALLLLTFLIPSARPSAAQHSPSAPPVLNGGTDQQTVKEGYYTLRWEHEQPGLYFVVEESRSPEFVDTEVVYEGPDLATFLSGEPNGELFYRVRARPPTGGDADWSPWSDTHQVIVAHHALSRAFTFLGVGAFVFLATVVLIIAGGRTIRE